ncbi:hypothetical protein FLONG3_2872 [Fusarium longipes]|uniref:Nephrocystin 3-like N-terminal domain-containing protein n=1 Tax=Fusarium longipes TaxID=694270 RepID=A0A395T3B3_9HYPO|nr:hypothetical protein FLONG3_2872 [Fusarium longipes]
MDPSMSHIPRISLQPPEVDFIDNHLDSRHPAFATPPSRYCPSHEAYIICEPIHGSESSMDVAIQSNSTTTRDMQIPSRPLAAKPMVALEFWDNLFQRAMDQLKEEHPTDPDSKQQFSIRDKTDCTAVFDQLDNAKESYCKKDKSFKAKFTRIYRKVTDNAAEPMLGASKFVPNIDYVTPVLGAVQILLEAAIKAAKVRQEALSAFDDIDKVFNKVEGYLQIYSNDQNLEEAAVDLIAAVFHAIECVISFFVKSPGKKAISVTFNKEGYQDAITESLSAIKTQGENLIAQADMSGKFQTSNGLQTIIDLERARADQLVNTAQLRDWLVSPHSAQLLIHGNYDIRRRLSGLTLLCSSLADSLADKSPKCLYLVFYCGLHANSDQDEHTGGLAIIKSFIRQLLCQYDLSNCIMFGDVRPDLLCHGNISELCCLFERLVFHLPRHMLLVCLIDGVVYYEREEFMQSMADVLITLLKLSDQQKTGASVKVLLTSPTKTMAIRQPFPDELILCMESRNRSGVVAGRGRLERQLNEQMDSASAFVDPSSPAMY